MNATYRALVVDDEASIRRLTIRSLSLEGFSCDAAADGDQAQELINVNSYDVVVTDLRMPNQHGYALASNLLEREKRPLVAVLTGVAEPTLAKELLRLGVDALDFKPVVYELFAAKILGLVKRRMESSR